MKKQRKIKKKEKKKLKMEAKKKENAVQKDRPICQINCTAHTFMIKRRLKKSKHMIEFRKLGAYPKVELLQKERYSFRLFKIAKNSIAIIFKEALLFFIYDRELKS